MKIVCDCGKEIEIIRKPNPGCDTDGYCPAELDSEHITISILDDKVHIDSECGSKVCL